MIFNGLSDAEHREAEDAFPVYHASRGERLLTAGIHEGRCVLSIECGLNYVHPDGTVIAEGPRGSVAGVDQVVWPDHRMSHSVVARDAGKVLLIRHETLARLRESRNPAVENFELYVLQQIANLYEHLRESLRELATGPVSGLHQIVLPGLLAELVHEIGVDELLTDRIDPVAALRSSPYFEGASDAALAELALVLEQHTWGKGIVLVEEFHVAYGMYLVAHGELEFEVAHSDGGPRVVGRATPGALVGFGAVLGSVSLITIRAAVRTVTLGMLAKDIQQIARERSPRGAAHRLALLRAASDAFARGAIEARRLMLARA